MSNMNPIINELLNQYYLLDRIQRASQAQIYRQIKAHKAKRDSIGCRFFTWLGGKLVIVGMRMLGHYGKISPIQNHRMLIPGEN